MATHLLRYMPPRGQEVKTHRSVLKFKLSPPNSKYQSTPVSVDRSKTPAQEAAEWIANPKEWPDYVPSYEVWCAMTCSSGNELGGTCSGRRPGRHRERERDRDRESERH